MSMHPVARDMLLTLGRIGIKAGTKALESVLSDVAEGAKEVASRTERASEKLRGIADERQGSRK